MADKTIFEYEDPHQYLRDVWGGRKTKNPALSIRGWAYSLGLKNNAPLSLILQGRRPIPRKYIPGFIKTLQLQPNEAAYFEIMVALSAAKSDLDRGLHRARLRAFQPARQNQFLRQEQMTMLEEPLHSVVYEMAEMKAFRPDPAWIAKRLDPPASVSKIEEILKRLIFFGMLTEKNGRWTRQEAVITTLPGDIPNASIRTFHRESLAMAQRALDAQAPDAREFNTHSLAIRRADIPEAKARIRDFTEKFLRDFCAHDSGGEQVFQIAIQFFGRTVPGDAAVDGAQVKEGTA